MATVTTRQYHNVQQYNQRVHVSKIFFTTIDNVIHLNASKIVFQDYTLIFFI